MKSLASATRIGTTAATPTTNGPLRCVPEDDGFSKRLVGQNVLYVFQTDRMHGRILERASVRVDYCVKRSMKKANIQ